MPTRFAVNGLDHAPIGTVTSLGTGNNTNETTLWTYSLAANTLDTNTKAVRITAWGTTAANANNKTVKLYFGSTVVANRGTHTFGTGGSWHYTAIVSRTGAATQVAVGSSVYNGATVGVDTTTPTESLAGAVTIKVTGQNGTSSANDSVLVGALVECVA